ncbi:hypothetical protein ACEWY4_005189 [Coilia grayii]|uniref:SH3 domain-containing protein n=1 Tax=Coilia grayii TaxID=363190 RepID=A0ABD1KHT8_9TELE
MAIKAQVLYEFIAEPGNNELSVREGETITILNQNVGGGWIEAQNSNGDVGLVPEDYIEVNSSAAHSAPQAQAAGSHDAYSTEPAYPQGTNGGGAWPATAWTGNNSSSGNWDYSGQQQTPTYQQQGSLDDDEGDDESDDGRSAGGYAQAEEGALPSEGAPYIPP